MIVKQVVTGTEQITKDEILDSGIYNKSAETIANLKSKVSTGLIRYFNLRIHTYNPFTYYPTFEIIYLTLQEKRVFFSNAFPTTLSAYNYFEETEKK